MKTVLVTGCAGFIGSHLTECLLARGDRVIGIDSFEDFYPRPLKERNLANAIANPGFELVEANIVDLAVRNGSGHSRLHDLISASDIVIHMAAQAGVRSSWGESFEIYLKNNVHATQLLLEAARGSDIEKFVYSSSSSVYGESAEMPLTETAAPHPISPYGVTKLAGENLAVLYARAFAVPTVSLRYFTVYGPRQRPDMAFQRFITLMLADKPIEVYGDGLQVRDFTYVDDIVSGILRSVDSPHGSVFNLGGGSKVSLRDAIALLEDLIGTPAGITWGDRRAGDVTATWASLTAAGTIGYVPEVDLRTGLARHVEWARECVSS